MYKYKKKDIQVVELKEIIGQKGVRLLLEYLKNKKIYDRDN